MKARGAGPYSNVIQAFPCIYLLSIYRFVCLFIKLYSFPQGTYLELNITSYSIGGYLIYLLYQARYLGRYST